MTEIVKTLLLLKNEKVLFILRLYNRNFIKVKWKLIIHIYGCFFTVVPINRYHAPSILKYVLLNTSNFLKRNSMYSSLMQIQ